MEHSVSQYASDDFGPAHDAAVVAAKAARLRYVNDRCPGIVRERNGKGFVYRDPSGVTIDDRGRQRGPKYGFVPIQTVISRPLGATRAAANSIAIMRDGEAYETTRSSSTCLSSGVLCRQSADKLILTG